MKYSEIISFKTTKEQAEKIHGYTHGTTCSASELIRNAVDKYIEQVDENIKDIEKEL